jgi:hypothetical protein
MKKKDKIILRYMDFAPFLTFSATILILKLEKTAIFTSSKIDI